MQPASHADQHHQVRSVVCDRALRQSRGPLVALPCLCQHHPPRTIRQAAEMEDRSSVVGLLLNISQMFPHSLVLHGNGRQNDDHRSWISHEVLTQCREQIGCRECRTH